MLTDRLQSFDFTYQKLDHKRPTTRYQHRHGNSAGITYHIARKTSRSPPGPVPLSRATDLIATAKRLATPTANVFSALRSVTGYLQLRPQDTLLSAPALPVDDGRYQVLSGYYVGRRVILALPSCKPTQLLTGIQQEQHTVRTLQPAPWAGRENLAKATDH